MWPLHRSSAEVGCEIWHTCNVSNGIIATPELRRLLLDNLRPQEKCTKTIEIRYLYEESSPRIHGSRVGFEWS